MLPDMKDDPDYQRHYKLWREVFGTEPTMKEILASVEYFVPSFTHWLTGELIISSKCKCGSDVREGGYCIAYEKEKEWLEIRDKLDKEYGPLYGTRRL